MTSATPQTTAPPAAPAPEPIPLPITHVTCLEDRAQVERSGQVQLAGGTQRLRIGPVTPLAVDSSLRADVTRECTASDVPPDGEPARILDARVVRTYTPAPPDGPGEDASALRLRIHSLEEEIRAADLRRQRLESRLAITAQAKTELHRDIAEGAGAGDADPERWADRLDRVDVELEARAEDLRRLHHRRRDLTEQLAEARQVLACTEDEPEELSAVIEVVVAAQRPGPVVLRVVHLTPCALWRPAYRATLAPDGASLQLETDAVVWQRTGEDWAGVRLSLSTARPTLAASPPALVDDVLTLRDRTAEERRTVEVDLREEEIRNVGEESTGAPAPAESTELPGVDDGGEVWVMAAPAPVSLACDGRPNRVHLSSFTAPCRSELTCSPELSPLVTRVAEVTNPAASGHVLLAGPVDLVRGSGFVGRGLLRFAGIGEQVRLSFGSEDTFRVVRHMTESRETTGLTGINSRTVIARTVRLFVSRLDARTHGTATTVVVRERVPVSEVSAVEVRLNKNACHPAPDEIDSQGIVRYQLTLGPGQRQEIELNYEISASDKVVGL